MMTIFNIFATVIGFTFHILNSLSRAVFWIFSYSFSKKKSPEMTPNFSNIQELLVYINNTDLDLKNSAITEDLLYLSKFYLKSHPDRIRDFCRWLSFNAKKDSRDKNGNVFDDARICDVRSLISSAISKKRNEYYISKNYTITEIGYSTEPNDQDFLEFSNSILGKQ